MNDSLEHGLMELSTIVDDNTEFVAFMGDDSEGEQKPETLPEELPILPLRNMVLFPGVIMPITIGRDKSIKLVKDAHQSKSLIGVVSQKDMEDEDPGVDQLYRVGTTARILKLLKMPDGSSTVIIQGKMRFTINSMISKDPYIKATVLSYPEPSVPKKDKRFNALVGSIKDLALNIIKISPNIPSEASIAIKNIDKPSFLINFICSNMNADIEEKQGILEVISIRDKAEKLLGYLTKELQMLELKVEVQSKVKTDLDQQQREYFLHQQMKQIQEELGGNPQEQEVLDFRKRAKKKKWNKEIEKVFSKEIEKLNRMNSATAEYSVQINYIDTLLDTPFDEFSKDKFDLKRAERILNRDHYGLDKVKDRILEHLAVLKLKGDMKSPIICLHGPPGVGKTSLGKSIAEALGRKYVRMSLGGLRDEAEIRGHRKTYIGAMPGRIIQSMKKAGYANPVFVLDEVDKVGNNFHGDPSSALLEVLDPEQNTTFYDNFLEVDFDLSNVLFIATANTLSTIQPALLDRLELIEVTGYTVEEKIEIAKKHLIPKQLKEHGVKSAQIKFSKPLLEKIIEEYTRESGVRGLEKRIAKIIRQQAKCIAMEESYKTALKPTDLNTILGPGHSKDKYIKNDVAGVVTGLAWTAVGGDILFVESSITKGSGKLTLTGNLGDVMKESATLALEFIKSHAQELELDEIDFEKWNVHIHVPEGATPKDGPSAGVTMLTSLASGFTQRKVKPKIAMTGEITLRGKVLAVGGIKEKILAAKRAGITEIIISEDNRKDIEDIEARYMEGLKFLYVSDMQEVVEHALTKTKVKNPLKLVS